MVFAITWEQRKLGDLCTFKKGRGYSKSDLKEAGTPIILYGRLYTNYQSRLDKIDTFAEAVEGSVCSMGNEVIVPASGETAEDIAVAASVRLAGVLLGGDLNVLNPCDQLCPDFLALSISAGNPHKQLAKQAQGKSVVHIHNADIAKLDFSFPCIGEQIAISRTILKLDSLITLHQREPFPVFATTLNLIATA